MEDGMLDRGHEGLPPASHAYLDSSEEKTTSNLSWVGQLQLYLKSTHGNLSASVASHRKILGDAVLENPCAAEAWLTFLQHEESIADQLLSGTCYIGSKKLSLLHWYHKATGLVQRSKGQAAEAYVSIWLGYARHQWESNEDEARDTFKTLKNQHIASTNAQLYHDWAALEAKSGNLSKAIGVLQKGISEQARPVELLHSLLAELQTGFTASHTHKDVTLTSCKTGSAAAVPTTPMAAAAASHTATTIPFAAHNDLMLHPGLASAGGGTLRPVGGSSGSTGGVVLPAGHQHTQPYPQPFPAGYETARNGPSSSVTCSRSSPVSVAAATEPSRLHHHHHHHHHNLTSHSVSSRSSHGSLASMHASDQQLTSHPTKSGMSTVSSDEDATVVSRKGHVDGNLTMTSGMADELGGRHAAGQHPAAAAAGGSGGGGGHTGTLSGAGAGIKRFGFKSKALRVTDTAPKTVGTVQELVAPYDGQFPVVPSQLGGEACQQEEQEEGGVTRKRRSETPLTVLEQQPHPPAVSYEGLKRRSSPDALTPKLGGWSGLGVEQVQGEPQGGLGSVGVMLVHDENRAPAVEGQQQQQQQMGSSGAKSIPPPPLFNGKPSGQAGAGGAARPALQPLQEQHLQGAAAAQPQELAGVGAAAAGYPGAAVSQPAATARTARAEPAAGVSTSELVQAQQQGQGVQGSLAQAQAVQKQQAQTHPAPQPQTQPQQQPAPAQVMSSLSGAPPERLAEPQRQAMEDANWVYVSGLRYQKLDCVGRGGSSKVFKVLGYNRQIYALKRVRMSNKEAEAIRGFIDEITLLKQLRNTPCIIQLISAQVFREEGLIYMVLEYGDIDLARLLHNHEEAKRKRLGAAAEAAGGGAAGGAAGGGAGELDENFIRLYWQQMLQAVHGIHELRIVHSDLKPANFMLVQGQLKLIDFGIAKSIQGDTTSISRESQVGTLNYMSPEAIQGGANNPLGGPSQKVGRPSDVWSLGCILYQMIYGRTPFADLAFIPKMNAICNPAHVICFPPCSSPAAVEVMRACLDRDPRTRANIQDLLDHPFLHPEKRQPPMMTSAAESAAGGEVAGVTEAQLKSIVSKITAGSAVDIEHLTRQVLMQLTAGGGGVSMPPPAAASQPVSRPAGALPPPPPPPPKPPALKPPGPPPPPPPRPPKPVLAGGDSENQPPAAASAGGGGGLGGAASAIAAQAAARASRLAAQAGAGGCEPEPAARPAAPAAAGRLMGAELHAAILAQRTQLKPVANRAAGSSAASAGAGGKQDVGLGAGAGSGGAAGEPNLEAILRKGLERFHTQDETGDTDFLAATLQRQGRL